MNDATIKFHLDNIKKNNRVASHVADLKSEISALRLIAFKHGDGVSKFAEERATAIEMKLREAILVSVKK